MVHVIIATDKELAAEKALRTFYGYVHAWRLSAGPEEQVTSRQAALPAFQALEGGASAESAKEHFFRGCLTVQTMESLPVEENPSLAASANFWAPVQAYYACHSFGLAAIAALQMPLPGDHRGFLSTMATNAFPRIFPPPFSYLCEGDASGGTIPVQFPGSGVPIEDVLGTSNLVSANAANAHLLVAKSLLTTRRWWLDELFFKQRASKKAPGRSRRNLSVDEKRSTATKLHRTSALDFLYRMRVRSNYDDPEMFVYGRTDEATAVQHYQDLLGLVGTFRTACKNIIEKKIGKAALASIQRDAPVVR